MFKTQGKAPAGARETNRNNCHRNSELSELTIILFENSALPHFGKTDVSI